MATEWLIDSWLPLGHKGQITAPEGSFKTMWNCYLSVCIAGGFPVLGHDTKQGTLFILDEETPKASLENLLDRFAQGFGLKSYHELPIKVSSMAGFRFGRKVSRDKLLKVLDTIHPIFVSLSDLPAGNRVP